MLPIPDIDDARLAFGDASALPAWDDIPQDFRDRWHYQDHPWCRIPNKWFHEGGSLEEFGLTPKEGVNQDKALRIIKACLSSWEPKHQHKIAGVAYMLSEWFDMEAAAPEDGE